MNCIAVIVIGAALALAKIVHNLILIPVRAGEDPCSMSEESYCSTYFDDETIEKLEAAAFRSLRQHLQDRSDVLSNMELMTVSGFCRNCLAKVRSR